MDHIRRKKIAFRAWHRGFREADLILGAFSDLRLATMSEAELDQFELLLEEADHDIYNWIAEKVPTPPEFETRIMSELKAFRDKFSEIAGPRGA
jgi:antitoxin CptB